MPMSSRLLRPRAAVSTAFDPRAIANLSIWLDASVDSSLTLNGSNVSEWRDLSGNARHYSQATAANQPSLTARTLGGRRAIDFTDTSYHLLQGNSETHGIARNISGISVFAVVQFDKADGSIRPVWFASTNANANATRVMIGTNVNEIAAAGRRLDTDSFSQASAVSSAAATVMCGVFDYANSDAFVYLNGSLGGSNTFFQTNGNSANSNSLGTAIGSNNSNAFGGAFFDGAIGEIAVYPRVLSTLERQAVERYLGAKWGITVA
jgi:hypothetical protein